MNIEQKAKAYDEALERAKIWKDKSGMPKDKQGILDDIFPELAESEDERIRKEIIDFATKANNGVTSILANNYNFNKWIAWLEKQGEQKPAEDRYMEGYLNGVNDISKTLKPAVWSEEDEKMIQDIINDIAIAQEQVYCKSRCEDEINWLKSLKGRVQPQPKQEWSEKDKCMLNNVIDTLKPLSQTTHSGYAINSMIDWLKSLKPQNTWKPSDEQMKALYDSIPEMVMVISEREMLLNNLYKDLKKLREE